MFPLAAGLLLTVLAAAIPAAEPGAAPILFAQAADIGADQAASIARGATGGRVLGVRRIDDAGAAVYEVKVLLDGGLVRTVRVNGATGAVF